MAPMPRSQAPRELDDPLHGRIFRQIRIVCPRPGDDCDSQDELKGSEPRRPRPAQSAAGQRRGGAARRRGSESECPPPAWAWPRGDGGWSPPRTQDATLAGQACPAARLLLLRLLLLLLLLLWPLPPLLWLLLLLQWLLLLLLLLLLPLLLLLLLLLPLLPLQLLLLLLLLLPLPLLLSPLLLLLMLPLLHVLLPLPPHLWPYTRELSERALVHHLAHECSEPCHRRGRWARLPSRRAGVQRLLRLGRGAV